MVKKKNKTIKKTTSSFSKQTNRQETSSNQLCPVWLYDKIDNAGSFAFDTNREDFKHKLFLEKMISYSNMKWQDIVQHTHDQSKSKHHLIPAEKLCKEAQKRIHVLNLDEYSDSIFSFAFENKFRVFGIREAEKFHVLWYDPEHKICPKEK